MFGIFALWYKFRLIWSSIIVSHGLILGAPQKAKSPVAWVQHSHARAILSSRRTRTIIANGPSWLASNIPHLKCNNNQNHNLGPFIQEIPFHSIRSQDTIGGRQRRKTPQCRRAEFPLSGYSEPRTAACRARISAETPPALVTDRALCAELLDAW